METRQSQIAVEPARRQRLGRPDGSSVPGVYQATWVDEDLGARRVTIVAGSEDEVRGLLEQLTSSVVQVYGPVFP